MKKLLLFKASLFVMLVTMANTSFGQLNNYYETFQIGFEDRELAPTEIDDIHDGNDAVIQGRAIYRSSGNVGDNIGEILIILTPVASGATDTISLRFNSSLDNSGVYVVHKHSEVKQRTPGGKIYSDQAAMFDNCTSGPFINTMVGHTSCEGKVRAISLVDHNLTMPFNIQEILELRNTTQGYIISNTNADAMIFTQPINTGFVKEFIHWYDGYLGIGTTETYGGQALDVCDTRDAGYNPAVCDPALKGWFTNNLTLAKLTTDAMNGSIDTPNFRISQVYSSSSGTVPLLFGGSLPKWEPQTNLTEVTNYFTESFTDYTGTWSGLSGGKGLRRHRVVCEIVNCGIRDIRQRPSTLNVRVQDSNGIEYSNTNNTRDGVKVWYVDYNNYNPTSYGPQLYQDVNDPGNGDGIAYTRYDGGDGLEGGSFFGEYASTSLYAYALIGVEQSANCSNANLNNVFRISKHRNMDGTQAAWFSSDALDYSDSSGHLMYMPAMPANGSTSDFWVGMNHALAPNETFCHSLCVTTDPNLTDYNDCTDDSDGHYGEISAYEWFPK